MQCNVVFKTLDAECWLQAKHSRNTDTYLCPLQEARASLTASRMDGTCLAEGFEYGAQLGHIHTQRLLHILQPLQILQSELAVQILLPPHLPQSHNPLSRLAVQCAVITPHSTSQIDPSTTWDSFPSLLHNRQSQLVCTCHHWESQIAFIVSRLLPGIF